MSVAKLYSVSLARSYRMYPMNIGDRKRSTMPHLGNGESGVRGKHGPQFQDIKSDQLALSPER